MHLVTDQNFHTDVLQATTPGLVDFWAAWCGPCQRLATIVEEVAALRGDTLRVCKMDIDQNPETPSRYGVRGIPTLMLFQGGTLVATRVGGDLTVSQLQAWVDQSLAR